MKALLQDPAYQTASPEEQALYRQGTELFCVMTSEQQAEILLASRIVTQELYGKSNK